MQITDLQTLKNIISSKWKGVLIMLKNIAKLIDVKSLVTLILTAVFAVLAVKGMITPDQFLTVFTTVIAFYFGTQSRKKEGEKNE